MSYAVERWMDLAKCIFCLLPINKTMCLICASSEYLNQAEIQIVPQKITVRLSASIAFKIVNQSEYVFGL